MWGAIIGDLMGSIYEFEQVKKIKPVIFDKDKVLKQGFYSDDTILTMALIDAILNKKDYKKTIKKYGKDYLKYKPDFAPYFEKSFSPNFIKWLENDKYTNSKGNGAMMRVGPIGYLFNSEFEVKQHVKAATEATHSELVVKYAEVIALIIYWKRIGYSKEKIKKKIQENYSLKYIPFFKFNITCEETINNVLYVLFKCQSFEECLKEIISYGGDTDTNACIVGSMAEIFYGIPPYLIEWAKSKIPSKFVKLINDGYTKIK